MVSAGNCGFCETCFILASIATLAHSRILPRDDAQKALVYENQSDVLQPTAILGNTDTGDNSVETKFNWNLNEYEAKDEDKTGTTDKPATTDGWCVVWYLGAFGSLVCFFLIITCMELFFRMPQYRQSHLTAFIQNLTAQENKTYVPETPPPPYHLFAPPDYYETVQKAADDKRKTLDIFVIPVYEKPPPPPPAVQHV